MRETATAEQPEATGQMSFLEHLDELRKRLVNSVIIVVVAFMACWFLSGYIYDFLSVPIRQALSEASRRNLPAEGITGNEKVLVISEIKAGDSGRYLFDPATTMGPTFVSPGASVKARVADAVNVQLGR